MKDCKEVYKEITALDDTFERVCLCDIVPDAQGNRRVHVVIINEQGDMLNFAHLAKLGITAYSNLYGGYSLHYKGEYLCISDCCPPGYNYIIDILYKKNRFDLLLFLYSIVLKKMRDLQEEAYQTYSCYSAVFESIDTLYPLDDDAGALFAAVEDMESDRIREFAIRDSRKLFRELIRYKKLLLKEEK
jgi:hypothetical protein